MAGVRSGRGSSPTHAKRPRQTAVLPRGRPGGGRVGQVGRGNDHAGIASETALRCELGSPGARG